MPAANLSRTSLRDHGDDDDEECYMDKCPTFLKHHKRKAFPTEVDVDVPASPTPTLVSESSLENAPMRKCRKYTRKAVTFESDATNNVKQIFHLYDKVDTDTANDIWWSRPDLKKIMKREGQLVLNVKLAAAANESNAVPSPSLDLKKSINETFKKCVDEPLASPSDLLLVKDIYYTGLPPPSTIATATTTTTTTTRGLERYIAPIMGAHRQMVVQNLLSTQEKLIHQESNHRNQILSASYTHMSKVAANFATVLGELDAQVAAADHQLV